MKSYRHILVLIHDERDGLPLLRQTVAMVRGLPIAITVGHLNTDYAELEYGSDALVKDRQAQEVIAAKAMLSRLVSAVDAPVAVKEIVTIRRFKDVNDFIHQAGIDLVVVGHQNRLFGLYSSYSLEFVNRLDADVLVKHLARE
ncbi:universal stress protein [Serratia marcescens]|nr:universal stress protein [Serratia marcescens]